MSTPSVKDSAKIVVEEIKIIENRNLMTVLWIFVSFYGIFTMIQYWPQNSKSCISLSTHFTPHTCGYFLFATYLIQPFLYCSLTFSLLNINFDIIDENDENPIEIKIENERDEEIQSILKQSQFSRKLRFLPSISPQLNLSNTNNDQPDDESWSSNAEDVNTDDVEAYDHLHSLIYEKLHKCEDLAFPLCILFTLIIVEVFIVIYFNNFWYIIQIFTDFFGYLLWLIYTSILTKLKFEHKIENSNTKVLNYIFLFMSVISLCIMTYEMLSKDLGFNQLRKYGVPQIGFIQIIIESALLLELLSIVVDNLLHLYCSCFHHSYHPIHDAPDISHLLGKTKCILHFLYLD